MQTELFFLFYRLPGSIFIAYPTQSISHATGGAFPEFFFPSWYSILTNILRLLALGPSCRGPSANEDSHHLLLFSITSGSVLHRVCSFFPLHESSSPSVENEPARPPPDSISLPPIDKRACKIEKPGEGESPHPVRVVTFRPFC
jgi:hypothetical protein